MWVSPFRYLRLFGYLLLPVAFRSLSRLSSALSAKASTLRSFLLDLFRCIALHLSLSQLLSLLMLIRTYKNFRFYLGLLFSDVLNFSLKEYFQLSLLYEVFKVQNFLQSKKLEVATQLLPALTYIRAMETVRFELMTPCLQGRCSPN